MHGTIEIVKCRKRRRRWSTSEKLCIVAETFEQGAKVGDVAARHGAHRSLVFTWRRQARNGLLTADVPGEAISPFVPIRLLDGQSQPMEPPISAPSPSSPAPSRTVEISLSGGSVVRVDQHVDTRALPSAAPFGRARHCLCVPGLLRHSAAPGRGRDGGAGLRSGLVSGGAQAAEVLLPPVRPWPTGSTKCRAAPPTGDALERHVMAGDRLHADDAPVPVLAPGTGKTVTAFGLRPFAP